MRKKRGIVAAGHDKTAHTASEILLAGGNAFDAALAAMLTACVAEPVLASPGGGGFLTAMPTESDPVVYDFFAQTPRQKQPEESIDFHPIVADFGTASQVFHIGMGSIATPGFIRGLFAIHRELCRLPLEMIAAPAIQLAREGLPINPFQDLIARIVAPILQASPGSLAIHASPTDPTRLIQKGEIHVQPLLADFFAALQHEGEALFYEGEVGKQLIEDCRMMGGRLRSEDLQAYQVIKRHPLQHRYRGTRLITNPLPSLGGTLIAFSLGLLEAEPVGIFRPGSEQHLRHLSHVMRLTQEIRRDQQPLMDSILSPEVSRHYRSLLQHGAIAKRGTTQISIADSQGNLASMTLSNGEGCGYVIPDTGIMMNNMLGEEDLNPNGFHCWPENQRLSSMMAPSLLLTKTGDTIVTGSGGSNRIRSAILQVISNLLDFGMPLEQAISQPRIHYEANLLSLESGILQPVADALSDEFPQQQRWGAKNLFFGGAHTVIRQHSGRLTGMGDERRGGVSLLV
ncbi:MAG: gamma-glutamyltransferase [Candidatus Thiodiazotropha sp. (ex Notomyrtea botanica)]|nr:gamma-glutamyltransferase [Candidatus Thiodiazotropha sp. (ex Notomyrtea botanica)]